MIYTKEQAIKNFGEEKVKKAMSFEAEPTSRTIYPGYPHYGESEWAGQGTVKVRGGYIQALYYLTDKDEANIDGYDWDDNVEIEYTEGIDESQDDMPTKCFDDMANEDRCQIFWTLKDNGIETGEDALISMQEDNVILPFGAIEIKDEEEFKREYDNYLKEN